MIDLSQFKVWGIEEFKRTFPRSSATPKPNGAGAQAQGVGKVDEIDETDLTDDIREWVHDGEPVGSGKRSTTFFVVVKALKGLGYSAAAISELFLRYPDGKYLDKAASGSPARLPAGSRARLR
jgi:hypothetical protein